MIEDLETKKMMLHCFVIGLHELGFEQKMAQHIVHEHFLPLTTFKNEYGEIVCEAFKDLIEFSNEEENNEYN